MSPELLETLARLFERSLQHGSPLYGLGWQNGGSMNGHARSPSGAGQSPGAGAPSLLDALRTQQLLVEELVRIQTLLLKMLMGPLFGQATHGEQPAATPAPTPYASSSGNGHALALALPAPADAPPPESEPDRDAPFVDMLRAAEQLLLLHPVAAQSAFSALIAEGRRFAETERGQAMARALSGSAILPKLRRVWEATTLNMLEERSTTAIPSMYVEAIFRMARSAGLEDILSAHHADRGDRR